MHPGLRHCNAVAQPKLGLSGCGRMLLELIGGDGASDWPGANSLNFATPVPGTFTTGPVVGLVTSGWMPGISPTTGAFATPAGTRSSFSCAPAAPRVSGS